MLLKCGLAGVGGSLLLSGRVQGALGLSDRAVPDLLVLCQDRGGLLAGGLVLLPGAFGTVIENIPGPRQVPSAFGLGGLLDRQISVQLIDGLVRNLEEVPGEQPGAAVPGAPLIDYRP